MGSLESCIVTAVFIGGAFFGYEVIKHRDPNQIFAKEQLSALVMAAEEPTKRGVREGVFLPLISNDPAVSAPEAVITAEPAKAEEKNYYDQSRLDGFPEDVKKWGQLIMTAAEENGLPPGLIASVIQQESKGDPDPPPAGSWACGLMQVVSNSNMSVNPYTGKRYFAGRPSCDELKDPEFNINYGSRYLRQRIDQAGGSIIDGLMGYGPVDQPQYYLSKVTDWWQQYDPEGYGEEYVKTDGNLK